MAHVLVLANILTLDPRNDDDVDEEMQGTMLLKLLSTHNVSPGVACLETKRIAEEKYSFWDNPVQEPYLLYIGLD